jgi:hypothetical protein
VRVRFYRDSRTGEPHLLAHGVSEWEAESILTHATEDRPGQDGARIAVGQTEEGRYIRVVYVPDPEPDSVFVVTALRAEREAVGRVQAPPAQEAGMSQNRFPPGWDEERARRLIEHYESQTEDEAVAEDEAALEDASQTLIEVPNELVPAVRAMIARHKKAS